MKINLICENFGVNVIAVRGNDILHRGNITSSCLASLINDKHADNLQSNDDGGKRGYSIVR